MPKLNAYEIACKEHGKKMAMNLKERWLLYEEMEKNPKFASLQKKKALNDILYFFKYFAWTHDPRPKHMKLYGCSTPMLPFLLYDYQEESVLKLKECIDEGQDAFIDKSRDMGVSWEVTTVFDWYWLQPTSGNDFLIGSRKEELVDKKGSQDTLFQKIRYVNEALFAFCPIFMPKGFNKSDDNVMFIRNPETGSYIKGEANNQHFATGGRYRAILVDEFAKWEETDRKAWISMGDSSQCRIAVSTPNGMGNKFAELKFGESNIVKLSYHWPKHPIKSAGLYYDKGKPRSIWYDEECLRRAEDPDAIKQELDISYLGTGRPYFNNEVCQSQFEKLSKIQHKYTTYEFLRKGIDDISIYKTDNGRIIVLEEPVDGWEYRYCIGSDVAEGLEKSDNTVFYVYDRVTKKDVAWFVGHIYTDVLALLLMYMGKWYHDAYIGIERNNHGEGVIKKIKYLYRYLYRMQEFNRSYDIEHEILGWHTNASSKGTLCSDLREVVHLGIDGIQDKQFYVEAQSFVTKGANGLPQADGIKKDDRIIAQGIKLKVHQWLPAPKQYNKYENVTHEGMIPFGIEIEHNDNRAFWN